MMPSRTQTSRAAYFEIGDYKSCIAAVEHALELLADSPSPTRNKLSLRLCNAHLHLHETMLVRNHLKGLETGTEERLHIEGYTDQLEAIAAGTHTTQTVRQHIWQEVSIYKPALCEIPRSLHRSTI